MRVLKALVVSFIASFSTVIGGSIIFFNIDKEKLNKYITFFLSFSLSVMISISIFDLIPNSIIYILYTNHLISIVIIILLFLICLFIIKILNKKIYSNKNNLYKIGIISMIIMILHNFPEGIITYLSSFKSTKIGIKMAISIAMHNIPEGICISLPIYFSTGNHHKALLKTFISGFSEFIGSLFAIIIGKYMNNIFISYILLLVAFLMISLSIEDLFPEAIKNKEYKMVLYGLIVGFIFIIISIII